MKGIVITFFLTMAVASAVPIEVPTSLFQSDDFKKAFVGSYGILADVEPKVSRAESEMLVTVRELFDKGHFAKAESELSRFIRATDGVEDEDGNKQSISPAMVFVLGTLYFQADRLDDARRAYLEAIRRYPKFRRAHTNLAYLYAKQEEMDKALPHLQQAIELGENSHRVFGLTGFSYLSADNPVAAETAYRQAIMLNGANIDWQMGLAQSLITQEKFEEAAALLGTLIKQDPNNKQLVLQQTNAYLEMDKKDDAAANLEMLRLRGQADAGDLDLLGNIYMDQEQAQLALFAYLAAIDADASLDVERALTSARILNDYGFPEKASALIAKVRSVGEGRLSRNDQVELYLVDLKVAAAGGDLAERGELISSLLSLDPSNGEGLLEKGKYHEALADNAENEDERMAQLREARTHYALASKVPDVSYQAYLALGQQLVKERRYVDGLDQLQKALELKSSDSLKQYVSRVQRAADREAQKAEREAAERAKG